MTRVKKVTIHAWCKAERRTLTEVHGGGRHFRLGPAMHYGREAQIFFLRRVPGSVLVALWVIYTASTDYCLQARGSDRENIYETS